MRGFRVFNPRSYFCGGVDPLLPLPDDPVPDPPVLVPEPLELPEPVEPVLPDPVEPEVPVLLPDMPLPLPVEFMSELVPVLSPLWCFFLCFPELWDDMSVDEEDPVP